MNKKCDYAGKTLTKDETVTLSINNDEFNIHKSIVEELLYNLYMTRQAQSNTSNEFVLNIKSDSGPFEDKKEALQHIVNDDITKPLPLPSNEIKQKVISESIIFPEGTLESLSNGVQRQIANKKLIDKEQKYLERLRKKYGNQFNIEYKK